MALDLLVFGPHPDDIEIGLGGTVARHTAAGHAVGLCDLTEGELSSNGTREERRAEALAASRVLGAQWRENLRWPDGGIAETPDMIRSAVCSASRSSGSCGAPISRARRYSASTQGNAPPGSE